MTDPPWTRASMSDFALVTRCRLRHFGTMRGFFTALLCLAALALPPGTAAAADQCPPAPAQSLSLPRARAAAQAGQPLTIIAFGSSSTEGSGASANARTYPAQLQA